MWSYLWMKECVNVFFWCGVASSIICEGVVSTVAGGGGSTLFGYVDGVGSVARFNGPHGISSLSTGDLAIVDRTNHIIRKMTSTGVHWFKFLYTSTPHSFSCFAFTCIIFSCSSSFVMCEYV